VSQPNRRQAIGMIAAIVGCAKEPAMTTATANRMPVLFQAHGAPPLLDDAAWVRELADWAKALPRPKSIVVVSAHWEARPLSIGATRPLPLIYDFYGFPERF
jgi:4,5-DOPA dioxygenase extradiol